MSEFLIESHQEPLQYIIRALCEGKAVTNEIERFEHECDSLSHEDLSSAFKELDNDKIDFRNNDAVIHFYNNIIEEKVARGQLNQYVTGHPARVYLEENILLRRWIKQIWQCDPLKNFEEFKKIFNKISKVELHYQRKENQLFPCLEKHGWDSPSKNMWAFHDDNRALLKTVRLSMEAGDKKQVKLKSPHLFNELERMMQVEEQRLIPNAMELLEEDDWIDMREGDSEIGWILDEEPAPFPAVNEEDLNKNVQEEATAQCPFAAAAKEKASAPQTINSQVAEATATKYIHPSKVKRRKKVPFDTTGMVNLDEGYMTPEQINLIFKTLPMDITYVDEHGKVLFYNRGQERLFPRSPGIIGREVHLCHPPKSVDMVLKIVEEFKKGTRNTADFRINIKGSFVLIRYFAVRDEEQNYRGVMEMSQDITDIQTLEGEQRLLDWD